MKNKKIPLIVYLFFALVYANQGLSDLPGQCIYYLLREHWHLSVTMLGIVGFVAYLAWYVKPLFGILVDYFGRKKLLKNYLFINTFIMIIVGLFIVIFGLNLWTLIITTLLINIAIAGNDVANDREMCILERKYTLKGRIQSIQWIFLAISGLVVAIGGAWLSEAFPIDLGYRLGYLGWLILPIATIFYLFHYKPNYITKKKNSIIKAFKNSFKDKDFILGLVFIACLRFSPSFGKALMVQMREHLMIDKMFIGYLGATGTVLGIIGYLLYYWKGYKFPMKKLLYFTIIFSAITNLAYLWIPNKWVILFYSLIFGAFDGICFLTILAYMARIVPIGNEGLFYAFVTSISNLSTRIGDIFGGLVYDNFGYSINVILATVTTLLCLMFVPKLQGVYNENN